MNIREKKIYRITLIGTAVNALLIALKFIAGIFGRSSAMVADAVHSLSDFVTDAIILIFVKLPENRVTKAMTTDMENLKHLQL